MRRSYTLALVAIMAAISVPVARAASPDATGSARTADITSVSFHGTVKAPVIEILCRGFGARPAADPPKPPVPPQASTYLEGGSGCTATPAPGLDYGTSLYISAANLSAGRYRPRLAPVHELDCVGLVIESYTGSHIVVRIGSAYRTHHYSLPEGERFEFAVKAARFHGTVHDS